MACVNQFREIFLTGMQSMKHALKMRILSYKALNNKLFLYPNKKYKKDRERLQKTGNRTAVYECNPEMQIFYTLTTGQ